MLALLLPMQSLMAVPLPQLPAAVMDAAPEQTIPVFSLGNLDVSPVFLDGSMVGLVHSRKSQARSLGLAEADTATNSRVRSFLISSRLRKYLSAIELYVQTVLRPRGVTDLATQQQAIEDQLRLTFVTDAGTPYISIAFPADSKPEPLYTFQDADLLAIRFAPSDRDAMGLRALNTARQTLVGAWLDRQRPALLKGVLRATAILAALIVLTLITRRIRSVLKRRLLLVQTPRSAESRAEPSKLESQSPALPGLNHQLEASALQLQKALLLWSVVLAWVLGIASVANQFFFSRPLRNWILGVSVRGSTSSTLLDGWPPIDWALSFGQQATLGFPLLVFLLLASTFLLLRVAGVAVDYGIRRWAAEHTDQRIQSRAPIIRVTLKGWIRVGVILLLASIIVSRLHGWGAFSQPLTILFGFLSLALSLASQNLIRDLINGLLILWEDQYVVGDVISIDDYIGMVEAIHLRITQLRNLDGELISIPNGQIGAVRNLSSSWSRVNFAIDLNYACDIDRSIEVITAVAAELFEAESWRPLILEPPVLLGVDELSHKGFTVRLLIKTQPLMQWDVAREYRRRLKRALDEAGLDIGTPRLELRQEQRL
ncbi:mechanosensitive ion channel family protein [Synechococcus sp. RSCCF101]|uniref:mechanosensitive ion channel family protein n=1 Tax=Synechococcus sp. RSCCF101 TaxID=2511069 RepID=UPI001247E1C5|nr:mechanosensitive ion channel family protein [Synechococcus sp. RSCCF101]QEY32684.1 mechanosensitive ion channel family protein [Synechococcus sp. RSCCF101]